MPDTPARKRPPTSGTRKGNGPGWGGAAKGAPPQAKMAPAFEAGNQAAAGYHDMSRSQRLAALDERKWQIAMGEVMVEQVAMKALESYENRHLGTPVAKQEHSGPDGAAIPTSLTILFRKPKVTSGAD